MDFAEQSLELHKKHKGKISVISKVPLNDRDDLSRAYTPGVAAPCLAIAKDPSKAYEYTSKGNMVAIVSDGSAVLGLGNIGGLAGLPVMEGKAILFKEFGGIDAFPIVLSTQNPEAIIATVKAIAPTFGGINLEDIKAPECFMIEEHLQQELDIPVFHDDQHGTAIVVLAALINALKVTQKKKEDITIIINGAGAAGTAIANLLSDFGVHDIIACDTNGAIFSGRKEGMNSFKEKLALNTNRHRKKGMIADVIKDADVFIGVSMPKTLTQEMIQTMHSNAIIFALANPVPEIMPDEAKAAGAAVIGTGRSDFPNQINNVLAFPGVFRGALDARAKKITEHMKLAAAIAIASYIPDAELSAQRILPSTLDKKVGIAVAQAVQKAAAITN